MLSVSRAIASRHPVERRPGGFRRGAAGIGRLDRDHGAAGGRRLSCSTWTAASARPLSDLERCTLAFRQRPFGGRLVKTCWRRSWLIIGTRNKFKRRYVRADAAFANPTASCGAFTPKIFRG